MAIVDRLNLILRSEWHALRHGGDAEAVVAAGRDEADALLARERRLRDRYQHTLDEIVLLEREAELQVRRGQDSAAHATLKQMHRLEQRARDEREALDRVQGAYTQLREKLDAVDARLHQRRSAEAATPRQASRRPDATPVPTPSADRAARAMQRVQDKLDVLTRAERDVERLEAEAEAMRTLNADLDPDRALNAELDALQQAPTTDPLARLHARLRRTPPNPE